MQCLKLSGVWRDRCRDEHGWHVFCGQRRSDFDHLHISACATWWTCAVPKLTDVCVPGPCGFQGICLCATTRMSTTLQMNYSCGTSPWEPVVAQTTGMSTTFFTICNCGISTSFCTRSTVRPWTPVVANTGHVNNVVQDLQLWMDTRRCKLRACQQRSPQSATVQSPRASAQRARSDHGHPSLQTPGMSTTLSKICNCGISIASCACGSNTTCTTKKSTTSTMCSQLSSPRPAPVEPTRQAQQRHRPPFGCTATVESTSSSRRQPLRHSRDVDDLADGLQQRTSIGTVVIGAVEIGKTVDATVLVVGDLLL